MTFGIDGSCILTIRANLLCPILNESPGLISHKDLRARAIIYVGAAVIVRIHQCSNFTIIVIVDGNSSVSKVFVDFLE